MRFFNIDGTSSQSFQIGLKENAPILSATEDGALKLNAPLQITGRVEGEKYTPTNPEDLATVDVAQTLSNSAYVDATNYAKDLVLKALQNGGGSSGETNPDNPDTTPPLVIGNQMPDPVTFSTMEDGYELSLAVIERAGYIHQIVMEIQQGFASGDPELRYEMAIGTDTEKNTFVDWIEITNMASSKLFNVLKTVSEATEVKLFVRDWVDPNPWNQTVENPHPLVNVTCSTLDHARKIWTVRLDTLTVGTDDIYHTDIFGEENLGKALLDFGLPIKINPEHRYRITQTNNDALQYLMEKDPTITVTDGIYSKDSEYGPFPDSTGLDDSGLLVYWFLLGQSKGETDYTHINVYDLDGKNPGTAEWVFHVKNDIMPITPEETNPEEPETGSNIEAEFISDSEGTMVVEPQEDGTTIISLNGQVHNRRDDMWTDEGNELPAGNFTAVNLSIKNYDAESVRLMIINPAFEGFYGNDPDVQFSDGNYYIDQTFTTDGVFTLQILISDKPGDIHVIVLGPDDENTNLVTIQNNLTFYPSETDTTPETEESDSPEVAELNDRVTVQRAVTRDAIATKRGRALMRVITF